jgi:hypothetical protein
MGKGPLNDLKARAGAILLVVAALLALVQSIQFLLSLGDMAFSPCKTLWFLFCVSSSVTAQHAASIPGDSSFVAPAGFPTSAFSSYYVKPAKPTKEPQPAIFDPILRITYPANLTDPNTIPDDDNDPVILPTPLTKLSPSEKKTFINGIVSQVSEIIEGNSISGNCSKCIASLSVAKSAAIIAPDAVPDAMVSLCQKFQFHNNATCEEDFKATTFGAVWTQILRYADVAGLDGNYICASLSTSFCPAPKTSPLDTTSLFPKPKPKNPRVPKASGKRVKVAHLSDFHLDPRYDVGGEANCSSSFCCR